MVPVEVVVLIVDYGHVRVEMPHSAQGDFARLYQQSKWCEETFKWEHHRLSGSVFYFKRKKDLMWFLLRWA